MSLDCLPFLSVAILYSERGTNADRFNYLLLSWSFSQFFITFIYKFTDFKYLFESILNINILDSRFYVYFYQCFVMLHVYKSMLWKLITVLMP